MATIGLDKLFYAPITEDENGDEEYGTPVMLAKAMTAALFKVVLSEYLFQILFRCCSRADTVIFHKEIQHTG